MFCCYFSFLILFYLNFFLNIKGILFAKADQITSPTDLIRLYIHESDRVYCDKLIETEDIEIFQKLQKDVLKKQLEVI